MFATLFVSNRHFNLQTNTSRDSKIFCQEQMPPQHHDADNFEPEPIVVNQKKKVHYGSVLYSSIRFCL